MRNIWEFSHAARLVKTTLMLAVLASPFSVQAKDEGVNGALYIQTNEITNVIIHYARKNNGKLVEIERIATGGKGSGTFKEIDGLESAPNAFEGVGSVILSSDHHNLFATNGGDNSVSSFKVGDDGALTLVDVKPSGQAVIGRSGSAKSLAYSSKNGVLYVAHSYGPDHIHLFNVKKDGKLELRADHYAVNTPTKTDRIPSQIVLSPDGNYLMADILLDRRPLNPDGSSTFVLANEIDKDGLAIFPVKADGGLGTPRFVDSGGVVPFAITFLNNSKDTFINAIGGSGGLVLGKIDSNGNVTNAPIVTINQSQGAPSELCWVSITPDNKLAFATVLGYSYVSSFKIKDGALQIAKDPAAPTVPGDGTFRALDNLVSSGPSDSFASPDGKYFYQIYGNASKLVAYKLNRPSNDDDDGDNDNDGEADGSLIEIDVQAIPYNGPQGMAGF